MVQNRRLDPRRERREAGTSVVFQEVEDPRRGNAKRHDLHETLVIALLSMLTGGRTCVEMEDYECAAERRLREFLTLKNGISSHDTFSRLSDCWTRHSRRRCAPGSNALGRGCAGHAGRLPL